MWYKFWTHREEPSLFIFLPFFFFPCVVCPRTISFFSAVRFFFLFIYFFVSHFWFCFSLYTMKKVLLVMWRSVLPSVVCCCCSLCVCLYCLCCLRNFSLCCLRSSLLPLVFKHIFFFSSLSFFVCLSLMPCLLFVFVFCFFVFVFPRPEGSLALRKAKRKTWRRRPTNSLPSNRGKAVY